MLASQKKFFFMVLLVDPLFLPFSNPEQGQTVLVIETGVDEHANPLTIWGYFFPSTFYSHLYRNFFTLPEQHVNNRRLYHMSTKALGGGTAVNAMVWTWGDRRDWDMVQVPGEQQGGDYGGRILLTLISHLG